MEIEYIRQILVEELSKLKEGKFVRLSELECSDKILDELLFDYNKYNYNNEVYKKFSIFIEDILDKIDFKGISFDNFKCSGYDFSGLKGISINPQKNI